MSSRGDNGADAGASPALRKEGRTRRLACSPPRDPAAATSIPVRVRPTRAAMLGPDVRCCGHQGARPASLTAGVPELQRRAHTVDPDRDVANCGLLQMKTLQARGHDATSAGNWAARVAAASGHPSPAPASALDGAPIGGALTERDYPHPRISHLAPGANRSRSRWNDSGTVRGARLLSEPVAGWPTRSAVLGARTP